MPKHLFSLIRFLFYFSVLTACSSQGQVSAGKSKNPNPGLPQAAANNLVSQSIQLDLPTQTLLSQPNTPQPVIIQSPAPSQAAQAESPQSTASCTNQAELIKHLNILDNTAVDPGQTFAKLWRLQNTGTCVWTTDYSLAFYSGEQMGGQPSIPLPTVVQPGEMVDLRVDLVAPVNHASFTGNWVLQDASGNIFGVGDSGNQSISISIQVKPTPMPTAG
jgi:Ig-like domain from next to BRCA1 gene